MKKLLLALSVVVLLSAATIATTLWLWTGTPHGRLTVPAAVISKLSAWQESPFSRLTLQEQRVAFRESMQKLTGDTIPLADVRNLRIAGPGGPLPLRVYTPERTDRALPVIVYLHGGAWVWGDLETHDNLCRTLAQKTGAIVVAVDYRLAPEHRYPAAVDDAYATLSWFAGNASSFGADPTRIAVAGDSAGGNLAAAATLMVRERRGPPLSAQVLIYPMVDESALERDSLKDFAAGLFLTAETIAWSQAQYLPDIAQRRERFASPLLADDHHGLPPALIITAQFDPLRDEGEAYGRALSQAGVPVEMKRFDGVMHGFVPMDRWFPESATATDLIAGWLRERLSAAN